MATPDRGLHARLPARSSACFLLERPFPIVLPTGLDVEDLWQALSYRILREPADLLAHARRIVACHDRQLASRLPGALDDLHRVADGRGRALRARLLVAVRGRLSTADAAWFERALDDAALAPPEPFPGSVLPSMARLLASVPGRRDAARANAR